MLSTVRFVFPIASLAILASWSPHAWCQVTSRADEIRRQRIEKQAMLWPERTPGIVKQLNKYAERGLLEGARSGEGTNGLQLVIGGMRSGNGAAFGIGYRRVDLWQERVAFRTTARGTYKLGYMFDFLIKFPRLKSERGEVEVYSKYENSPMLDFYGQGPDSHRINRTSFRLEDTSVDFRGRYRVWRNLYLGAFGGAYRPNVGRGKRSGYLSAEEKFSPAETNGLAQQTGFIRAGGRLQYDYRDLASGPRDGGNYYATYTRYWDQDLGRHTFHRLDTALEQFFPYWNKTHVLALRLGTVMTWANEGQTVPFYLQPTLGGNEYLRGFARYRFYDQNTILASAEHRWHVFSGGYAAAFFEMGKVAPKASQLNFHNVECTGGIGIRFMLRDAVFMRIDSAVSREGLRLIWTFGDMW